MTKIKFEYKITIAYLVIGCLWILLSDRFLNSLIEDIDLIFKLQTYKGWFYVAITGLLLFIFLKAHLGKIKFAEDKLEKHQSNLHKLIEEKTKHLDTALEELRATNEELNEKNNIINNQNAELKTALQHFKETQTQLLQAEKTASLGILTAGVAHEINNPLNYILGGYTGLEKYFQENGTDNKKVALLMNHVKTGIDRSAAIVNQLDQFSRGEEDYYEPCNIHKIIENCLLMLNNQFKGRIEIIKDLTQEPFQVLGNTGKLHQVFINILLNASQAIANHGTLVISTWKSEKWLHIRISDSGAGISKENLLKVTDPFFTTKEPGKGTGLGLSITYSIVKEHKGRLEIESELNKGTTVKVKLPLKGAANE